MWTQAFLLLSVAGVTGAAGIIALVALLKRNGHVARMAALGAGAVGTGYVLLLGTVAAVAPSRTLALGEEKYICELDCHLAYSVVGVRRLGDSLIVRLNVRFDRETISSRRALDQPLYPGGRSVRLYDERGKRYRPLSLGNLERELLPGESYRTELVFEVVPAATGLVLYISDADLSKNLLVGSDNALLRTPVGFQL